LENEEKRAELIKEINGLVLENANGWD